METEQSTAPTVLSLEFYTGYFQCP